MKEYELEKNQSGADKDKQIIVTEKSESTLTIQDLLNKRQAIADRAARKSQEFKDQIAEIDAEISLIKSSLSLDVAVPAAVAEAAEV